jgi:D-amino-acid oxidase
VVGLSTAMVLVERGMRVKVVSATFSPNTTSDTAAAIWHPFCAQPADQVLRWAQVSWKRFTALYGVPDCGVSATDLTEYYRDRHSVCWWADAATGTVRLPGAELPPGYGSAYRATVPLAEAGRFLAYLRRQLEAAGVQLEQRRIPELAALKSEATLVVNCTGLGAAELASDAEVYPIRGQIVRGRASGVKGVHIDDSVANRPVYVIPRSEDCVLGGSADEEAWNFMPSDDLSVDIERRARALVPTLEFERTAVKVGLRPGRSKVRLELERSIEGLVVHNYGHGGSGFTMSWGCAEDAAELVVTALSSRGARSGAQEGKSHEQARVSSAAGTSYASRTSRLAVCRRCWNTSAATPRATAGGRR